MSTKEIATKLVERLKKEGFIAYFAGGWVRDFVMGHPSSDIDIATEAPPEEIIRLFKKTIPVGLAFASVIVVEEGVPFEVSTFREDQGYSDGRRPDRIIYSSPEMDAQRRDFTINGMFYDPLADEVIDYVGAREDLKKGIVRTIGDPNIRFKEDRLRMIRAVRFSARFNFPIEEKTEQAIKEMADTLFPSVAIERVLAEFEKMRPYPRFDRAMVELARLGLLGEIFPQLGAVDHLEVERRVRGYPNIPGDCPTVLFLIQLFPDASRGEIEEICDHLKCSNRDVKIALEYETLCRLCREKDNVEPVEWAHFYATPKAWLCIEVAASAMEEGAEKFLAEHRHRLERLAPHVERIELKKPLVGSELLKENGIVQGETMGLLLKEAERISVNDNLDDPQEVLRRLQESPRWPR